jgi:hypothetical protein
MEQAEKRKAGQREPAALTRMDLVVAQVTVLAAV